MPGTPLGNNNRIADKNYIRNFMKERMPPAEYYKFMGRFTLQAVISLAIAYLTPIIVPIVLVNKFM